MNREPFMSYAQNAEDVVLARALQPDDHIGFYVDVGAGHPILESATKAFSERGWQGVNIEPVAEFHALLAEDRPIDVNLNVAVAAVAGVAKLFVGPPENRGSSTMVPELAESYRARGQDFVAREVRARTLAQIADEHIAGTVDFLKIDVEGMEREVLEGNDWDWFRPRIIVIEATVPNSREPSHMTWEPWLLTHDYMFVLFDGLNRFYVRSDETALAERLAAPANVFDHFVPYVLSEQAKSTLAVAASLAEELERAHEEIQRAGEELRRLHDEIRRVHEDAQAEIERAHDELDRLARRARHVESKVAVSDAIVTELADSLTAAQYQTARALASRDEFACQVDALRREIAAIEATRIFRHTAGLRARYAKLRSVARRFGA
jgi:FkbM family methyltransferase